jgi:hypothetical protein
VSHLEVQIFKNKIMDHFDWPFIKIIINDFLKEAFITEWVL